MAHPLVAKLEQFALLSDDDRRTLVTLTDRPIRYYEPRIDIVREGEVPRVMRLILSGWACRYKQLPDGRRQVLALLLPGDLCDHHVFVLPEMDHTIGTLTHVTLVEIPPPAFEQMLNALPQVTRALWWESLVNAAMLREWVLSLGARDAVERLSHLLCELFYRLRAIGQTDDDGCDMPLTQADLANLTGLTPVHINRTLQALRRRGLVELNSRRLAIPNLAALERVALFDSNYLHFDRARARLDA